NGPSDARPRSRGANGCCRLNEGSKLAWCVPLRHNPERDAQWGQIQSPQTNLEAIPLCPTRFLPRQALALVDYGKRAENIGRARELLMPPIIPVDAIKAIGPNAAEPEPQTTNLC